MDSIHICDAFVGVPFLWTVLHVHWSWTTTMDELNLI